MTKRTGYVSFSRMVQGRGYSCYKEQLKLPPGKLVDAMLYISPLRFDIVLRHPQDVLGAEEVARWRVRRSFSGQEPPWAGHVNT